MPPKSSANFEMAKRVIIQRGPSRVYGDLEEAAQKMGISTTAVSRKLSQGEELFWRERTYAIKTKDGRWHIAHRITGNKGWKLIDDCGGKVENGEVVASRDISEGWYNFGMEFARDSR